MTTTKIAQGWIVEVSNEFVIGRQLLYKKETLGWTGVNYGDDPHSEFLPAVTTEK